MVSRVEEREGLAFPSGSAGTNIPFPESTEQRLCWAGSVQQKSLGPSAFHPLQSFQCPLAPGGNWWGYHCSVSSWVCSKGIQERLWGAAFTCRDLGAGCPALSVALNLRTSCKEAGRHRSICREAALCTKEQNPARSNLTGGRPLPPAPLRLSA